MDKKPRQKNHTASNEITCGVCMDLMPLVHDGIASADSQSAVKQHIRSCTVCSALYGQKTTSAANTEQAFQKFRQQLRLFSILLMMLGICIGLALTAGIGMFYNSLIMPVIGVLGYAVFRRKAFLYIPVLLLLLHGIVNLIRLLFDADPLDAYSLLAFTVIYIALALAGTLIASLLYFAFRKENRYGKKE